MQTAGISEDFKFSEHISRQNKQVFGIGCKCSDYDLEHLHFYDLHFFFFT